MRSIKLQGVAADLDAEAATWRLLSTLHGILEPTFPAGAGGPEASGVGGAQTAQQQSADRISSDPDLNRYDDTLRCSMSDL